jgi:hypothetical protein
MALTSFQLETCRLLAKTRIASGESYVAGGAALNELIGAARLSRDVDLFHDTDAALDASWAADRRLLEASGYHVKVLRERGTFVEAEVARGSKHVVLQWVRDSAYRFFPLIEHADLGLVLHPFDLATNKVLALVGRLEVRDWIDVIECDARLQPLGLLAWAACGKDPGFSPLSILEHAAGSAKYSSVEVASLDFAGEVPDAADLSRRWHGILSTAREMVDELPPLESGKCVLDDNRQLFRGTTAELRGAISAGRLAFREGSIRGVLPEITG